MPSQEKPAGSPFEIITPGKSKKVGKTGIIVGITIVIFLILSVVAGVLLVRQQQNIQEKAASVCANGYTSKHAQECKKNCTNDSGTGWYYINATSGASCPAGPDGEARHLCDYDECDLTSVAASPSPTPTATPNLQTDNNNCGAVGNICTGGMTCQAGQCAAPGTSPTPTPTGLATDTPTPTPTSTDSGAGNSCNGTCGSNSNCQSGLYCYSGYCRNPLCASDSACGCSSATNTPTPTASPVAGVQTTPLPVPVTGTDWPTVAGVGVGIGAIVVSIILAL